MIVSFRAPSGRNPSGLRFGLRFPGYGSSLLNARNCLHPRCAKGSTWPTWSGVFGKKQAATMAFKTLKTKREAVTLEALGQSIERRRKVAGDIAVPRNPGKNRTPSKRALLKAIKNAGGDW